MSSPSRPALLVPEPCMPAGACVLALEAEVLKRAQLIGGDENDVAAFAAVAAVGAATRDKGFAAEADATRAAVAPGDSNFRFVDKTHGINYLIL